MPKPRRDLPRLIVVSAVHPFPGASGQQQRVRYKLAAFRSRFHTTFLTVAPPDRIGEIKAGLQPHCDESIVLPSRYNAKAIHRLFHRTASLFYAAATGLKRSNYVIGKIEFPPGRVGKALGSRIFDVAIFEYWHAAAAVSVLSAAGARCALDMHNVLWRSYDRQLQAWYWLPAAIKRLAVARYRAKEERAWRAFDTVITINGDEHEYVCSVLGDEADLIHVPMGIDLEHWPYSWAPISPRRFAYYGGLGSRHNQRDAMVCLKEIMPEIWKRIPEAEFWIVGSNPPRSILEMPESDPRVHVTGFIENVVPLLATMSVVLCPWTGMYGFRSRVIEVLAIGVPLVVSREAVSGMGLDECPGIRLTTSAPEMASAALSVLADGNAGHSSWSCRKTIEALYSRDATYGALINSLCR